MNSNWLIKILTKIKTDFTFNKTFENSRKNLSKIIDNFIDFFPLEFRQTLDRQKHYTVLERSRYSEDKEAPDLREFIFVVEQASENEKQENSLRCLTYHEYADMIFHDYLSWVKENNQDVAEMLRTAFKLFDECHDYLELDECWFAVRLKELEDIAGIKPE
ncbi:MAG: hypothetical protein F6K50_05645 [Moorea sp. SIO3I7]|nr:hypothetical protein [Moorena sp. SIO3I7]